ncbi:hypothetical protein J6590_051710 [Homalodisca vitripennis]|nr:hypothetical protein J6590_051710 [Homalodisca vitripennis]
MTDEFVEYDSQIMPRSSNRRSCPTMMDTRGSASFLSTISLFHSVPPNRIHLDRGLTWNSWARRRSLLKVVFCNLCLEKTVRILPNSDTDDRILWTIYPSISYE